ncbi:hypothetical protein [Erythrobacter colymbi]|uniref:hypothetical protein n=1 Tax=Erythrobacter colymbi TaxID=1161202 RepID=UPI001F0A6AFE|nr:hypothetical protein [Erythrobacter colymbi]
MSNWSFEDLGDFADDAAAERWAKRNDIDLRDIRTTGNGRGGAPRGPAIIARRQPDTQRPSRRAKDGVVAFCR